MPLYINRLGVLRKGQRNNGGTVLSKSFLFQLLGELVEQREKKQIKINQSADIPCIYIKWIERANCLVLSISCSVNASAATPNSKKEQQQSTTDYRKNFVLLPDRRFLS